MAKHYEEKFKKMIVTKHLDEGVGVTKLCTEYKLNASMVYKWIKIYSPQVVIEDKVYSQKDIDDLNKKIRDQEEQIDILKKATAIFAQKK